MPKKYVILILLVFSHALWGQSAEVITIGPGDAYWSAFGHTAIKLTNQNGQSDMYGFGYFDFSDDDFFINFMFGDMRYYLGVEDAARELNYAAYQERTIHTQQIALTAEQYNQLQSHLQNLALPENRQYAYDYFSNNCTSQVRDILDDISGGVLHDNSQQATDESWYDVSFPAPGQGWMNLGIAIGFGWPAHQNRTQWELMSLPHQLMGHLEHHSDSGVAVISTDLMYQPKIEELQRHRWVNTHYPLYLVSALLIIGLLIPGGIWVARAWLILQSLIGMGLVFLWFFTEHSVAHYNFNVLLFMPLAFLFLSKRFPLALLLLLQMVWLVFAWLAGAWYLWPFVVVNVLLIFTLWQKRLRYA